MISCIVLAGGKSKRMGRDKAFLKFKGKTFLKNVLDSVSKICDEIIIVGNREEELYLKEAKEIEKNVYFTKDIHPYEGPLNGVISALPFVNGEKVFIATCDTPLISPEIIDLLNREIDEFDAVIPVIKGKFQPLNTLYKRQALKKAEELYKEGNRSLSSFIKKLNVKYIDEKKILNYALSYWSINTPEDYKKLISGSFEKTRS